LHVVVITTFVFLVKFLITSILIFGCVVLVKVDEVIIILLNIVVVYDSFDDRCITLSLSDVKHLSGSSVLLISGLLPSGFVFCLGFCNLSIDSSDVSGVLGLSRLNTSSNLIVKNLLFFLWGKVGLCLSISSSLGGSLLGG